MQTHIYEVVDCTDDERYYPLGVYLDKQEAIDVLKCEEPPHNEDDPEAVSIEVRERPLGFHPHQFKTVAERQWVRTYGDEGPEWQANPLHLKA